ncbi:MAG: hypothetical protein IGQ88_06750 [Gloeomargaritaceae cyanobacterium C42_A2020_066]|nr:hypothetical protein [Gloeomargaritaceae cyanobacterium C42_A2020_066]
MVGDIRWMYISVCERFDYLKGEFIDYLKANEEDNLIDLVDASGDWFDKLKEWARTQYRPTEQDYEVLVQPLRDFQAFILLFDKFKGRKGELIRLLGYLSETEGYGYTDPTPTGACWVDPNKRRGGYFQFPNARDWSQELGQLQELGMLERFDKDEQPIEIGSGSRAVYYRLTVPGCKMAGLYAFSQQVGMGPLEYRRQEALKELLSL